MEKKLISLVIPVYNEEEVIPFLFSELYQSCTQLTNYNWELVIVDDGSRDQTVMQVQTSSKEFPWPVRLTQLSRNFGHQAALTAGISQAQGHAIICLDADMQDPPTLFSNLLEKFAAGYDVVYAVRRTRAEGFLLKAAFKLFYQIFQHVSNIEIAMDSGDFGLISRRVADHIVSMPERDILLRGLRSWVGFKQIGVEYDRPQRLKGTTKYRLAQRFKVAGGAFFGFSHLPLRISTWAGGIVASFASFYFIYILIRRFTGYAQSPGWLSLTSVVLLMGGVQLITIGILGEYIGRIYQQVQARPLYIIDKTQRLNITSADHKQE
jgi:dolichol-phosphate mannosyltransferase